MSSKEKVFLIDGSGYIFRAYFAIRHLTSKKGVPTNAVYGFTTMLLKLLKEQKPKYLAIAFDAKEKTFRHEMYADYKANRPPAPEDLVPQFPLIQQVVDAFEIPRLLQPGFEADDLLGSMAKKATDAGHEVVIVTGDKDLMQLVTPQVTILDELRGAARGGTAWIDEAAVVEKFGVSPDKVIDVLALMGDSSDNVPGVRGIGPKTAALLIQEYGSVENTIANAEKIKQKSRREKLIAEQDMALLSKKLVTIPTDLPLAYTVDDLLYERKEDAPLVSLFQELSFERLLKDPHLNLAGADAAPVKSTSSDTPATPPSESPIVQAEANINHKDYLGVFNQSDWASLVKQLEAADCIAFDTETDSLTPTEANLVGLSFSWAEGEAAYVPLDHETDGEQLTFEDIKDELQALLRREDKRWLTQNGKYDQLVMKGAGITDWAPSGDSMIASYLLYSDGFHHGLDEMSERHLGHVPISYTDVCGSGKEQISFRQVPMDKAVAYAAEDADLTRRLCLLLEPELKKEGLDVLYHEVEMPLANVLAQMEGYGIKLHEERLHQLEAEFVEELTQIEKQAYDLAGDEFNLASPKQVGEVLFEKLQLPVIRKTKSGPSTDAKVLQALSYHHELPDLILQHRMLSKLQGTYVKVLPQMINDGSQRLHTQFNQTVTATGRLSSSNPNLQNIPNRTAVGRQIREAFIAEPGNVLLSLDYSQIELRLLAHVSEDPVLLTSFQNGEDVHARTASEIFQIPIGEVDRMKRGIAKSINFGLLYGMGPHRLSQEVGISRAEAKDYIDRYFDRYKGIRTWHEKTLQKAHQDLSVRTIFGRRRDLPDLGAKNKMVVQRAERTAINTPIQGSAADLLKKAMVKAHAQLASAFPRAKMLLQVHDELVLEVPEEDAQAVEALVVDAMENAAALDVPLVVEGGTGQNWAQAH